MLAASAQLYRAVQLAGAAYLVYLGIHGWRAARAQSPEREAARPALTAGFRAGLLSNLLNPKVGLFFLAVMPQFIPHHASAAGYALAFAATDVVIAGSWLAVVAWLSAWARELLRRKRARVVMDRAAGVTLAALGLKVAASQLA
jgi:threonine/homoserine/homoserine lactone efflux protein